MPRFTRECPVEVHQMESRRALFLPEKRGSSRVVAVLGGASGVPFLEAHAFSALQVYCRNQLEIHLTAVFHHGFFASSCLRVFVVHWAQSLPPRREDTKNHQIFQVARKLRRSCLPASWLFSGWNCAPQTFPRRAIEQKRLP